MLYRSTSGRSQPVPLCTAVLAGPAPDGGLYVPARLAPLPPAAIAELSGGELRETALVVARQLLADDVPAAALETIIEESLDFPIPLVAVSPTISALELFHGPTLAFKDVGARFMARLLQYCRWQDDAELTILVATSGDTGSAVAHAFLGLDGIRVVVLFPQGLVSVAQQKQFTTLGGNVTAVAVKGSFDDCQRLAKTAFADDELRRRRPLASANSINIGRLLPQIFYYFHLLAQLPAPPTTERPLFISAPSGNFGNLTAGLMAKRLGLPCARFVAATNVNDVVPRYLETGELVIAPSRPTLANAMDVGDPSNLRRILDLYHHRLDALRQDLVASAHDDDATVGAIREVHARYGYTLDPHSAIGYLALRQALASAPATSVGVFLATAHPAKFAETVTAAIEAPVPLPPPLAARLDLPEQVVPIAASFAALRDLLLDES